MQEALLGRGKVGSKVYLSTIAVGLAVCLRKKIFVFFFLAWMLLEAPTLSLHLLRLD